MAGNIIALVDKKSELDRDPEVMEAMKLISTIDQFKVLVIKDDNQERDYTEMLVQAKEVDKALESRRLEIVDPYNKLVKSVNGYFKDIVQPVSKKIAEIEGAIKKWRIHKREEQQKLQQRAEREQARIETRAEKVGITTPIPKIVAPKVSKITRSESGSAHERKSMQVEVQDMKALAAAVGAGTVPVGVLKPDISALKGLVKAGITEIPGCRVYEDIGIATRRG